MPTGVATRHPLMQLAAAVFERPTTCIVPECTDEALRRSYVANSWDYCRRHMSWWQYHGYDPNNLPETLVRDYEEKCVLWAPTCTQAFQWPFFLLRHVNHGVHTNRAVTLEEPSRPPKVIRSSLLSWGEGGGTITKMSTVYMHTNHMRRLWTFEASSTPPVIVWPAQATDPAVPVTTFN